MFTYMILVSVFVTGMVVGGPTSQYEIMYEDMEMQTLDETSTAESEIEQSQMVSMTSNGGYERSSNLKYVMAIQKSSIWTDVKRRTMAISSEVNGEMIDKSPENMSDQELAQLKQACHDGLKCVAVDQLLILKTIKQQMDGGNKTGVRTAITKITKVLTEYTTEYHQDTYEYFEVTESDDSSKVYQSVTTIVEDNRELCKINVPTSSDDSASYNDSASYKNSSSPDVPLSDNSSSSNNYPSDAKDLPSNQQPQIFQNFGTVNNYNINQGTINEANINISPSDGQNSKPETQDKSTNTNNTPDVVIKLGEQSENKPEDNNQNFGLPQENSSQTNENQSYSLPQDDESQDYSPALSNQETFDSPITESSTPKIEASTNNSNGSESDNDDLENANNNSLDVVNTNAGGCGDTNVDVASSGPHNKNEVLKGYVDKGDLNNGNMNVYNINKGIVNEGSITKSNAKNGIISIGTVNKGPVSYGYYNDFSNNSTESTLNNINVQQYIADVDQMYSTILESLH